ESLYNNRDPMKRTQVVFLVLSLDWLIIATIVYAKHVTIFHLLGIDTLLLLAAVQIMSVRVLFRRTYSSSLSKHLWCGTGIGLIVGSILGLALIHWDNVAQLATLERRLNSMGIGIATMIAGCLGLLVGALCYYSRPNGLGVDQG